MLSCRRNITEILLKAAENTIQQTNKQKQKRCLRTLERFSFTTKYFNKKRMF